MKLPSLVRRMSVQEAREASLQERGPKNKFEKRILEALPKAIKRVEEFYGLKFQSIPPIVISHRQIRPDADALIGYLKELHRAGTISQTELLRFQEKVAQRESLTPLQKIARAIRDADDTQFYLKLLLRPRPWYYAPLPAISLPHRRSAKYDASYLPDLLTHELAHHLAWEQRSKIYDFKAFSSSFSDEYLASMCASEGIAMYCESWVHKEPEKGILAKIKRELSFTARKLKQAFVDPFVYPEKWFAEFAHSLMFSASMLLEMAANFCREHIWKTDQKLAKAVEKSVFARIAINPYSDGLKFAKAVSAALSGPKEAFRAITEKPPETMQEILIPERYLSRIIHKENKKEN